METSLKSGNRYKANRELILNYEKYYQMTLIGRPILD
jgi:hypothetical protein